MFYSNLNKYLAFGLGYGFVRKSSNVIFQHPKIVISSEYNFEKRERVIVDRPMLVTEKVSTIVAHSAVSAVYWPYFMTKDLVFVEASLRNIELRRDVNDNPYMSSVLWHVLD